MVCRVLFFNVLLWLVLLDASMLYAQILKPQKERLSERINTAYAESSALISPNGKIMYYVRQDNPDSFGGEDIWYSELQADGTWGPGKSIGVPLNNSAHNAVITILGDGKTILLLHRYNSDGSYQGPGYSISTQMNGVWGTPKSLEIRDFVNFATGCNSAVLSANGKVLLMTLQD